jgi:hypothetical protein
MAAMFFASNFYVWIFGNTCSLFFTVAVARYYSQPRWGYLMLHLHGVLIIQLIWKVAFFFILIFLSMS